MEKFFLNKQNCAKTKLKFKELPLFGIGKFTCNCKYVNTPDLPEFLLVYDVFGNL